MNEVILGHGDYQYKLITDWAKASPDKTPLMNCHEMGKLQPSYQLPSKPIIHGHDVCVDEDKNLYLCQWNAMGVAPYKLERI